MTLLLLVWNSQSDFGNFQLSPGYNGYLAGLSTISEPQSDEVDFYSCVHDLMDCCVAIATIYFPVPVPSERRSWSFLATHIRSHQLPALGFRVIHLSRNIGRPYPVWTRKVAQREGQEVQIKALY